MNVGGHVMFYVFSKSQEVKLIRLIYALEARKPIARLGPGADLLKILRHERKRDVTSSIAIRLNLLIADRDQVVE